MDRCGGLFPGMRIDPLCSRQLISCCRFSAGVQVGDWRPNNGQHQGKYPAVPDSHCTEGTDLADLA